MKVKKAVIPVAGLGTRFLPFTKAVPKEMLPIIDKPTIQYIVEEAVNSGIEDILFITNRNKEAIENYFDYNPELEASLEDSGKLDQLKQVRAIADLADFHYIRQKETKGLGHAILRAKDFVGEDPFAVILGDDVVYNEEKPVIGQLIEKFEEEKRTVVGCQRVDLAVINKYSSIDGEKLGEDFYRVKSCVEKPDPDQAPSDIAILGRYVFTPEIFEAIENTEPGYGGEIQLTDAIDRLARSGDLFGYVFKGKRYDIGNKMGFLKATVEFAMRNEKLGDEFKAYLCDFMKKEEDL